MTQTASDARIRLKRAETELEAAKQNIVTIERSCVHNWSEAKQNSKQLYGGHMEKNLMGHYTISNDGSINAPEIYIPAKNETWWERTCSICDKTQVTRKPKF